MIRTNRPKLAAREGEQMDVQMLIEHFIRSGRIANKSQETLVWYEKRLRQFVAFLKTEGHSMRAVDLKREDGECYIAHLMDKDTRYADHPYHKPRKGERLSIHTIHGHVRVIRALTNWAVKELYIPDDPFARLPLPRLPKRLYEILTEDEINRVLTHLDNDSVRGARLRTMFLLMLDTGVRAKELVGLKLSNVDVNQGVIKVLGKGNKERYVPIGQATQKEIATYLIGLKLRDAVICQG